MGLEAALHVDELDIANPVGATDPKSQGDDHLRMIKDVLKRDFPDVDEAVGTIHQKATAPTLTVPGTLWFDTTANLLKIRDEADAAWITLAVSVTTDNTVDINGGTIDGTPIGATTPDAGDFTTLDATGNATVGGTLGVTGLSTLASLTVTGAINFMPAGTVMLFFQAAAPTSWTQVAANNDTALRMVSGTGGGTGGTVAFETAFASQAVTGTNTGTAISEAQMPAHTHTPQRFTSNNSASGNISVDGNIDALGTVNSATTSTGGGLTHTHPFVGDAIDLDVSYINIIQCSKD